MARRRHADTVPPLARVALPDDLAPALREAVDTLLRQVPLARGAAGSGQTRAGRRPARATSVNRCVFCHKAGKLGGHHDEHGDVVWVHRKCHRRHHRAPRRTPREDRWWSTRAAVPLRMLQPVL